ncbi:MAG: CCA tRNA nucleotidyltransferase [Thermovirgaceae bacterium]
MLTPGITNAVEIMKSLSVSGFSAFIVGGAVRDILLCQEPADIDIATTASLEQVCALWPEAHIVGKPGSKSAVLPFAERVFDVVSFAEGDLSGELLRRDFTINAMALSASGELHDPWGGVKDLAHGLVKATGRAKDRLAEDPLRALRAARLVAGFSRFRIDMATASSCRQAAPALKGTAPERTGKEVLKALRDGPSRFLAELESLNLVEAALPFLADLRGVQQDERLHPEGDAYTHTLACCEIMEDFSSDPALRAAALLHDIGKKKCARNISEGISFKGHEETGAEMVGDIMRRWAWPKGLAKDITRLVRWHSLPSGETDPQSIRRLLEQYGSFWMNRLFLLCKADLLAGSGNLAKWHENRRLAVGTAFRLAGSRSPLDGKDVMEILGIEEGPMVGRALSALAVEMEQKGPMNTEEAADFLSHWFLEDKAP